MGVGRGMEEATRGDYEYNPPDRSVAKSAHSVQPSIVCRDRESWGTVPPRPMVVFSSITTGMRRVAVRRMAEGTTRLRGQQTLERARENIGSRV